jgi:ABC-type multidrug transport system ATPase subunit
VKIKIENLHKNYIKGLTAYRPAVVNLNLGVEEGEVFGFLGPNGAGKSTVIKILMNFIRASEGTASINNFPVTDPRASGQSAIFLKILIFMIT